MNPGESHVVLANGHKSVGSTSDHGQREHGTKAAVAPTGMSASVIIGQANGPDKDQESHRLREVSDLLLIARNGDVEKLRTSGVDFSNALATSDIDDRTPLHAAAEAGQVAVCIFLLRSGANPNAQDRWRQTPLDAASRSGALDAVAQCLVEGGGKVYNKRHRKLSGLNPSKVKWGDEVVVQHDRFEIEQADLELAGMLGRGAFGDVRLGLWRGGKVAVKTFTTGGNSMMDEFNCEMGAMQMLSHPNILQFLGCVSKERPLMLVTEYMSGGNLQQHLSRRRSEGSRVSAPRQLNWLRGLASGVAYLHDLRPRRIVHRDLKPSNILLDAATGMVKISDFGLCKMLSCKLPRLSQSDTYCMTPETGSYRYMAPEVFRHQPYDWEVDVYSYAIVAFEILEGQTPHRSIDPPLIAERAASRSERLRPAWAGEAKRQFGDAMMALVESCWEDDPLLRPPFSGPGGVCAALDAFEAPEQGVRRLSVAGDGPGVLVAGEGGRESHRESHRESYRDSYRQSRQSQASASDGRGAIARLSTASRVSDSLQGDPARRAPRPSAASLSASEAGGPAGSVQSMNSNADGAKRPPRAGEAAGEAEGGCCAVM